MEQVQSDKKLLGNKRKKECETLENKKVKKKV
jgi:hypothetical protein